MRSWVEISLGQIRANYRSVRAAVGANVDVMAVVKADAYRHGAPEAGPTRRRSSPVDRSR